jgi:protein TonB
MAYADQSMSGNKIIAFVVVALIHVVVGYALVTGLAYEGVRKVIKKVTTVDIKKDESKKEEPPPPKKVENCPPPIVAPPVKINVARPLPRRRSRRCNTAAAGSADRAGAAGPVAPPPPPPRFRRSRPRRGATRRTGRPPTTILRAPCARSGKAPPASASPWADGRVVELRDHELQRPAPTSTRRPAPTSRAAPVQAGADGRGQPDQGSYSNRVRWVIPE